jgi:hypothetical protein
MTVKFRTLLDEEFHNFNVIDYENCLIKYIRLTLLRLTATIVAVPHR